MFEREHRQRIARVLPSNSGRWADDAVYSRDLIDLAMMQPARLDACRQALCMDAVPAALLWARSRRLQARAG